MKNFQPRMVIFLACVLLFGVSCNDDSGDSPTMPLVPANVSGVWTFSGQLTKNACDFDTASSISGDITIYQSGDNVSTGRIEFLDMDFIYAGTVTGNSLSMAAVDPYIFQSDGSTRHIGSGISIQNIKDNSGSGSLNLTWKCIQGCTGRCQTVWTGTWTR